MEQGKEKRETTVPARESLQEGTVELHSDCEESQ